MQLPAVEDHQQVIDALIEQVSITQSRPEVNESDSFDVVVMQVNNAFVSFDRAAVTAHLDEFRKHFKQSYKSFEEAIEGLKLGRLYPDDYLYALYEEWPFGLSYKLTEHPNIEPLLAALEPSGETLRLFQESRKKAREAQELYDELSKRILESWRKRHPRFSSMGTVDADFQSADLKAARLDRR